MNVIKKTLRVMHKNNAFVTIINYLLMKKYEMVLQTKLDVEKKQNGSL